MKKKFKENKISWEDEETQNQDKKLQFFSILMFCRCNKLCICNIIVFFKREAFAQSFLLPNLLMRSLCILVCNSEHFSESESRRWRCIQHIERLRMGAAGGDDEGRTVVSNVQQPAIHQHEQWWKEERNNPANTQHHLFYLARRDD